MNSALVSAKLFSIPTADRMGLSWVRRLIALQDVMAESMDFFRGRGLKVPFLPLTTHSVSSPMGLGSDSFPVQVELCGVPTFLADSMQFMLEYACRATPAGVCYMMPSFRGEAADETHLCQFYHIEAEIVGTLPDVMALVMDYLGHLFELMLFRCEQDIIEVAGDANHLKSFLQKKSHVSLSVDEAAHLLKKNALYVKRDTQVGYTSITRAGERELMRRLGDFVWLTEPDHMSVPFYQAYVPGNDRKAVAADLLFGAGEVVGAGQRHRLPSEVSTALRHHGVEQAPYDWYLDMREKDAMQTSGFGIGTERVLMWVLKAADIRNCTILPRNNGEMNVP